LTVEHDEVIAVIGQISEMFPSKVKVFRPLRYLLQPDF